MTFEQQLMDLWTAAPDTRVDALADFGRLYADPVRINGVAVPLAGLVARARALHAAFADHTITFVDTVSIPGKVAFAFRHAARHVGVWSTPLGDLPPTDRVVQGLGIDILTVNTDGRVTDIWVLADELQRILQVHDPAGASAP
jgi:hypothetical protein